MTLEELVAYMKKLLADKEEDFNMADGADSNFHHLEGYVECLEHLISEVEGK